jgi:hypothetical protein
LSPGVAIGVPRSECSRFLKNDPMEMRFQGPFIKLNPHPALFQRPFSKAFSVPAPSGFALRPISDYIPRIEFTADDLARLPGAR